MEHGPIIRPSSTLLLEGGIRFFLAGALTASQITGGYAPFALGLVAAAGPGTLGAFALAGTAAGALIFMSFADALPHLAIAILILTAATSFQGSALLSRPKAMPVAAAVLALVVGGIYVVQSLSPLSQVTPCLAAAGLTGLSAWFFVPLLRPDGERPLSDSVLFLAAALLLAFSDLMLLGLSLGRAALCVLLAMAAYERGPAAGAAAGLGLGLTADLCAGTGLLTAGYGLAGLLAGSRRGGPRAGAAGAFLLAVLLSLLPAEDPFGQPLLLEAALGMGVFLLLPGRLFGGKRVKREEAGVSQTGNLLKERLTKAAEALRELYDSMGRSAPPAAEENPAIVFDRAAEKVCRGCALCALCWQKEYTGTFNALNDATPYLLERGRAEAKDFPQYFSSRCIHLPDFLTAINGELSAYLLRRQYRRQLEETRRSARGQYAQLSELLTATAAGLGEAVPVSAAAAAVPCQVGAALRPKAGESVCGDTLVSFCREDGVWNLLLADGMGSGEPARKESALTCRLLRQFLEAGIEPEAALKTLNAAMALRGAETGSFTTIDLCTFDPAAGEAVFYKYGAAPSYLKKGGAVRRVAGGSLPAGLRGTPAAPDITRTRLEPGSFAVMVSDGVADPNQDEWLLDLLAGWEGEDPQTLAGLILGESVRREHLQDDCGIQVLYRPAEGKQV